MLFRSTWSVEDEEIATVSKDATDPKKATITGVKAGKTKVTAEVEVTVNGKDFTVKAEKKLVVAGENQLVVNVEIETAPSEIGIGDALTLKAKADVDTASIEEVIWEIDDEEVATIETASLEATVTGVKAGKVTVTVTIKAKENGKEGEATASKEIEVIYVSKDLNLELSADTYSKTVPNYFAKAKDVVYSDGSASFNLPTPGNMAVAFDLNKTGELFDLSEYSKAEVTLVSDTADTAIRLGFTAESSRDFKDPEVKNFKIGTTETKLELNLADFSSTVHSFVLQHTSWADSAKNPKVTIKSIKLIAKE